MIAAGLAGFAVGAIATALTLAAIAGRRATRNHRDRDSVAQHLAMVRAMRTVSQASR